MAFDSHSKGRNTSLPLVPPCFSSLPSPSLRSIKKFPERVLLSLSKESEWSWPTYSNIACHIWYWSGVVWSLLNTRAPHPHLTQCPWRTASFPQWAGRPWKKVLTPLSFCLLSAQGPLSGWQDGVSISAGGPRAAEGERPEQVRLLGLCILPLWDPGLKSKQFFFSFW